MSTEPTPILKVLTDMTASSLEATSLDGRELMLARIAALVSVNAPAASYLLNVGAAADSGVTLDDVRGLLAGIAPIVGTARVVDATANITRALGFAIDLAEELAAEAEEAE